MPINYPVSVDVLATNRQNRVRQPVDADDINDIARYVDAIGAELGANPSGSYTDVAARLAEFRKSVAGVVNDASFTSTPADGATGVDTISREFYYRSSGAWFRAMAGEARTSPYTVYVDQVVGNDSRSGASPGSAVQTIAKAVALLQQAGHGGEVHIVTGGQAGNFDVSAPITFVYAIMIRALSPQSSTIRRTFSTPNGRSVWDAVTTAGGTSVQSATAAFVAGDVNRIASIYGAGTGGGTYYDFISAVPDGTHATLPTATAVARNSTTDPKGVKLSVVGDWNRVVTDAAMTSGGSVVTSATAAWTVADIGTQLVIAGAGRGGQALRSAIQSVSGNTATILGIASATVSGKRCAIGVNFGDLFTFSVGSCGLEKLVLTDETTGNVTIGAAIKALSEDGTATTALSPSDCVFDDLRITSTDAAGAWEHAIDCDGSWNQTGSGSGGARRFSFKACKVFGTRRPTETIRLSEANHWSFNGMPTFVSAPTVIAPGIMILDPQKTAGGAYNTQGIHFAGCEGGYLYVEGQFISFTGGHLAAFVAVSGRNVVELSPSSDSCAVFTVNAATSNALEIDQGTNNVIRTTKVKDSRTHKVRGGTIAAWRETYDRRYAFTGLVVTSGVLTGAPLEVIAGEKYGHVLFIIGSTAATFGSNNDGHWYVAVYDDANALVAQTADQGVAALAAFTPQALVIPSFTPKYDAIYSVDIMVYLGTGGTPVAPSVKASAATTTGILVTGMPLLAHAANAGLTTGVAPGTLTTTGSVASIPYVMLYT